MKTIKPAPVVRDDYGFWSHPELPFWNEDTTKEQVDAWAKENKGTIVVEWMDGDAPQEVADRYFEAGDADISYWYPHCAKAGNFLLSIHDTEDGPVALFFVPNAITWYKPEELPEVELGTETEYWIAVQSKYKDKPLVFLALYQNRPLRHDNDGDLIEDDWQIVSPDGDPWHSVGWVEDKAHCDFDSFYESIDFNDDYQLLGWAEYQPPEFKEVAA